MTKNRTRTPVYLDPGMHPGLEVKGLTTFSEDVENVMLANGDHTTAESVRLLRRWYEAEDEPSISVMDRVHRRLDLKEWLLRDVDMTSFPPPGSHVKDIPIVMFEGLLTGIDRRLQMFPFLKNERYNVRAVSSLNAENFFSGFQDIDPRGQGILTPKDIPLALSNTAELIHTRCNPKRWDTCMYLDTTGC